MMKMKVFAATAILALFVGVSAGMACDKTKCSTKSAEKTSMMQTPASQEASVNAVNVNGTNMNDIKVSPVQTDVQLIKAKPEKEAKEVKTKKNPSK